jgi:hypothetical protein
MMPASAEILKEKFPRRTPGGALEFDCLHAGVDVEHGLIRKEILKKYADTKELQEDCINAS